MRGDDVVEVVRSSPEWSGFEMRGLSLMESSISSPDVSRETSGPLRDRKRNGCSFKCPPNFRIKGIRRQKKEGARRSRIGLCRAPSFFWRQIPFFLKFGGRLKEHSLRSQSLRGPDVSRETSRMRTRLHEAQPAHFLMRRCSSPASRTPTLARTARTS